MWLSAVSNRFLYSSGQPCSLFPFCAIGPLSNVTPALYAIEEPGECWPHSRTALKCIFGVQKERRLLSNRAPYRSTQQPYCSTQQLNNNTSSSFPSAASISGLSLLCLDTLPRPKTERTLSFHSGFHPQLSAMLCISSPFMAVATMWKMLSPPAATSFFLCPAFSATSFIYFPLCRLEADSCIPYGHRASLTTLGSGSADWITTNPQCFLTCTFLYVHVVKLDLIRAPHKTMLFNVWSKESCRVDAVPFLATFSRLDGCVYSK